MGFSSGSNMKFMSISNGKFRMKVNESTEGAIERKNKNDKIVHELVFDTYTGYIIDMKLQESDYGDSLNLTVDDGSERHIITKPLQSPYFLNFVTRAVSIDFTKEILLRAWKNESRNQAGLYIEQDGKTLENFFIKYKNKEAGEFEYINGYPEFEGDVDNRREYDQYRLKRTDFLLKVLEKKIQSKIFDAAGKTIEGRDLPENESSQTNDEPEPKSEGAPKEIRPDKKDKLKAEIEGDDDLPF